MIINGMRNEKIDDYILKEIDLLEKCIERMAKNSFEIRKWTVGIISIISSVANNSEKSSIMLLCFIIICTFWYLDAYYLRYERMYVDKYNWIVNNRTDENLKGLLDLNPRNQYFYNTTKKALIQFPRIRKCISAGQDTLLQASDPQASDRVEYAQNHDADVGKDRQPHVSQAER